VHPELHEPIPALPVHIIGTYYGTPAPRVWRCGKARLAGTGRAGGIGIVPVGWDGHWDIDAKASLSYVLLSNARLQGFAEQWLPGGHRVELVPCVAEPDPVGSHILRALSRHAAQPERSQSLFVEQALDLLSMHLIRAHSSVAKPALPVRQRGLLPWQVRRVTAYMRERLDQDIGLDELAAQVNLSRFHFCTAFRLAMGRTPHEWLISLRIGRARELLADPRMSVTDIALSVGYKTPSAFTASFRKVIGSRPRSSAAACSAAATDSANGVLARKAIAISR
jgi:AraC family transcriptional regulator